MKEKECALCNERLPSKSSISICNDCLKCADCCTGLEKMESI